MRLTLIRHAQSVANAGGLTQPHLAIPLTAHGHTQARALGARLTGPAPVVTVSRFVRAQQTAGPYCQRFNLDPQVDADLDEFSLIDAALIAGLDGVQRKPFVQAYGANGRMATPSLGIPGCGAESFQQLTRTNRPLPPMS